MQNQENEILKKETGVRALILAILGIVVGSGIYVLPAIIGDKLGSTAILSYFAYSFLFFFNSTLFCRIRKKNQYQWRNVSLY